MVLTDVNSLNSSPTNSFSQGFPPQSTETRDKTWQTSAEQEDKIFCIIVYERIAKKGAIQSTRKATKVYDNVFTLERAEANNQRTTQGT